MFDTTGNLWIIDWNYSGYYSAFVEYMGIDAVGSPPFHRMWFHWQIQESDHGIELCANGPRDSCDCR